MKIFGNTIINTAQSLRNRKKEETLIDNIQKIRTRNNKNWMDLARLAFEIAPDRAKEIMRKITECDTDILNLSKELSK